MRKIIVLEFITLDGVIQAPGGPEEDMENVFEHGGWVAPFNETEADNVMEIQLQRADLLLGRKTFDIWEHYWPQHADNWRGVNEVTKYVLSTTRDTSDWNNSVFLRTVADIKRVKESGGGDLKIWGSSKLVQLLLAHDLVDEFWLNIHPIILGEGKRLFADGAVPRSFTLAHSSVTPKGVIMAHYKKAGTVKTGRVGE